MPRYRWKCEVCNIVVEVERKMSECGLEPDVEDLSGEDDSACKFDSICTNHNLHSWVKLIPVGTRVNYTDGWGGRAMKGRW